MNHKLYLETGKSSCFRTIWLVGSLAQLPLVLRHLKTVKTSVSLAFFKKAALNTFKFKTIIRPERITPLHNRLNPSLNKTALGQWLWLSW